MEFVTCEKDIAPQKRKFFFLNIFPPDFEAVLSSDFIPCVSVRTSSKTSSDDFHLSSSSSRKFPFTSVHMRKSSSFVVSLQVSPLRSTLSFSTRRPFLRSGGLECRLRGNITQLSIAKTKCKYISRWPITNHECNQAQPIRMHRHRMLHFLN